MVVGFLKDNHLDQERKRADTADAKVATAQVEAAAEVAKQQERERASLLLAELERLRKAYVNTTEVIIQRPQERDGSHPPDADSTE